VSHFVSRVQMMDMAFTMRRPITSLYELKRTESNASGRVKLFVFSTFPKVEN
jgi:hypothetical protein